MDVIQTQDRGTITELRTKHAVIRHHKCKEKPVQTTDASDMDFIEKSDEYHLSTTRREMVVMLPLPSSETRGIKRRTEGKKIKKKLVEYEEKNSTLNKMILDKNQEIAELKRSVHSLNEVLNSVPIDELRCNSSIASAKLIELSKTNRKLRSELDAAKNRLTKKEHIIQKLQKEMKQSEEKFSADAELLRKGNFTPLEEMQTKMQTLQQKLFESRNKSTELQSQLKLAQKCLQQEVGEHFNLKTLAAHPEQSNWRGRAQNILHLQQKLQELRVRLEKYEKHGPPAVMEMNEKSLLASKLINKAMSDRSKSCNKSETGTAGSVCNNESTLSFNRFTPEVRKSEIMHRSKVDALEKDISALKKQLEEQNQKVLALKVRNKTLNEEVIKYKLRACALEQQTDYNGVNLANLGEQMNTQRYEYESRMQDMKAELASLKKQLEVSAFQREELNNKLENMEETVMSKNARMDEMRGHICKLEDDIKALAGDFLFSCRELRKEEFIAVLDSLESEKDQLMAHNKELTQRIEKERHKNQQLTELASKHKIRIARADVKIRDLEKELDLQNERKKRSQRIADYANSVTSLNGSVGSFVFENSSVLSMANGAAVNEEVTQANVTCLKNQLEFATEKITMLEEKIEHLTVEKDNDYKAFEGILSKSKTIILDIIMQNRDVGNNFYLEEDSALV